MVVAYGYLNLLFNEKLNFYSWQELTNLQNHVQFHCEKMPVDGIVTAQWNQLELPAISTIASVSH